MTTKYIYFVKQQLFKALELQILDKKFAPLILIVFLEN